MGALTVRALKYKIWYIEYPKNKYTVYGKGTWEKLPVHVSIKSEMKMLCTETNDKFFLNS